MAIALINKPYSGPNLVCAPQNNSIAGVRLWLSFTISSLLHVSLSHLSCIHGKTSIAILPRNRCGAGSPNSCHNWGPRPPPPNLAETPKAAKKGPWFARLPVFPLFAKRLKCLNLFQPDEPSRFFFFISSSIFTSHGTSPDVLVLAVSLNVNDMNGLLS